MNKNKKQEVHNPKEVKLRKIQNQTVTRTIHPTKEERSKGEKQKKYKKETENKQKKNKTKERKKEISVKQSKPIKFNNMQEK